MGVSAGGKAQLGWTRTLTDGTNSKVTSVTLTINGVVEWRDVDGNGIFNPPGDIVTTVDETSYQPATVTDTLNGKGDTVHQLTLESTDNILQLTSYLAPKLVLVDNSAVPPKNNKFGIVINYPVANYKYQDSKLCVSLNIDTTLSLSITDPGTGFFVFNLKDEHNNTVHKVLWEQIATVGNTQTVVTLYATGSSNVQAYLCFAAPVPDVVDYDPQSDYATADQVTLTGTTAGSTSTGYFTVPSLVLVILSLLGLFL